MNKKPLERTEADHLSMLVNRANKCEHKLPRQVFMSDTDGGDLFTNVQWCSKCGAIYHRERIKISSPPYWILGEHKWHIPVFLYKDRYFHWANTPIENKEYNTFLKDNCDEMPDDMPDDLDLY